MITEIIGLEIIVGNMANTLVLIAVLIWMVGIAFAVTTDNKWKNVGITWAFLAIGATLFGIALTL